MRKQIIEEGQGRVVLLNIDAPSHPLLLENLVHAVESMHVLHQNSNYQIELDTATTTLANRKNTTATITTTNSDILPSTGCDLITVMAAVGEMGITVTEDFGMAAVGKTSGNNNSSEFLVNFTLCINNTVYQVKNLLHYKPDSEKNKSLVKKGKMFVEMAIDNEIVEAPIHSWTVSQKNMDADQDVIQQLLSSISCSL